MSIIKKSFEGFTVYSDDERNSFIHVDINDSSKFYKNMFEYFFDEARLLRYAENKANLSFSPTQANYATLYRKLALFIDKENDVVLHPSLEAELGDIIKEEYQIVEVDGTKKIRLDKIGKIGEYIFSNILSEYFGFECVIPKLNLTTDTNMSVFGIDTLFYAPTQKLILLGESKVSTSLDNGITLINKSLSTYQSQVDDEFTLILSQRWFLDKMGAFSDEFKDTIETSISMSSFINKAKISQIGIPIFIAHGGDKDVDVIFKKLQRINKISLYGLNTTYVTISLPLINKMELMSKFAEFIAERREYYKNEVE